MKSPTSSRARAAALLAALAFLAAAGPASADEAFRLSLQARNAASARDYSKAVECWTGVLALDPKDALAYAERARAQLALKDYEKAAADCTARIALTPGDPAAYEARAQVYQTRRGVWFHKGGPRDRNADPADTDKAIADYTEAVRLRMRDVPDPEQWVRKRAPSVPIDWEKDAGVAYWSAVLKFAPKDTEALVARGECYEYLRKWDEALQDFDAALAIDPSNVSAMQQRVESNRHAQSGEGTPEERRRRQIADLTTLLQLKPDKSYFRDRGYAWLQLGDTDKALADFIAADNTSGIVNVYSHLEKWDKAIEAYAGAPMGKEHDSFYDWQNRAWLYLRVGKWDKALADMNSALKWFRKVTKEDEADDIERIAESKKDLAHPDESSPFAEDERAQAGAALKSDEAWLAEDRKWHRNGLGMLLADRGEVHLRAGRYQKARADFDAAVALDPDALNASAWLYATCPDAKFRNGKKAVAQAMELCAQRKWQNADNIDTLAAACAESGKWDDAVKYEQMAIKAARAASDKDAASQTDRNTAAEIEHSRAGLEKTIRDYAARLALYKAGKPCREIKEVADWGG